MARKLETLRASESIQAWFADADGVVRAGMGRKDERLRLFARRDGRGSLQQVASLGTSEGDAGLELASFAPDASDIYVIGRRAGRRALMRLDIETRATELVSAREDADVIGVLVRDGGRTLAAVYYDDEVREFLDPNAAREQVAIDAALPYSLNEQVAESDADAAVALVASRGRSGLHRFFAFAEVPPVGV